MIDDEPRERNATCSVHVDSKVAEGIPRAKCALCKGRFFCGHVPCPLLSSIRIEYDSPPRFSSRVEDGVRDIIIDPLEPDTVSLVVGPSEVVGDREQRFDQMRRSVTATMERERVDTALVSSIALSIDTPRVALDIDHHSFRGGTVFSAVDEPRPNPCEPHALTCDEQTLQSTWRPGADEPAPQALTSAYLKGVDPEHLCNRYALGLLDDQGRMVPTSWARTTIYDICSSALMRGVKRLPLIEKPEVVATNWLGTDIAFVLMPRPWEFELIEVMPPTYLWALDADDTISVHEHETYRGASDQALRGSGPYYACRLAAAEMLHARGRQAAVMAIEVPREGICLPMGAKTLRQGLKTMASLATFDRESDAIEHVCDMTGIGAPLIYAHSMTATQDTLSRWF
jgi:hypothetical protein